MQKSSFLCALTFTIEKAQKERKKKRFWTFNNVFLDIYTLYNLQQRQNSDRIPELPTD